MTNAIRDLARINNVMLANAVVSSTFEESALLCSRSMTRLSPFHAPVREYSFSPLFLTSGSRCVLSRMSTVAVIQVTSILSILKPGSDFAGRASPATDNRREGHLSAGRQRLHADFFFLKNTPEFQVTRDSSSLAGLCSPCGLAEVSLELLSLLDARRCRGESLFTLETRASGLASGEHAGEVILGTILCHRRCEEVGRRFRRSPVLVRRG